MSGVNEAIEEPLSLLTRFISAVSISRDIEKSVLSTVVQRLCEEAPTVAQCLAEEILKHVKLSNNNSNDEDDDDGDKDDDKDDTAAEEEDGEDGELDNDPQESERRKRDADDKQLRRRRDHSDLAYRPSKSAKIKRKAIPRRGADTAVEGMTDAGVKNRADEETESDTGVASLEIETATLVVAKITKDQGARELSHQAEASDATVRQSAVSDRVPSTPIQVRREMSPQTEEVLRTDMPPRTGSALIPDSPSSSPPTDVPTLRDMVTSAIDVIDKMSRHQEDVPPETRARILSSLANLGGFSTGLDLAKSSASTLPAEDPKTWSESMWIYVLEAGESRSRKAMIYNLIGYMGASVWYDYQVEQAAKTPALTKRRRPRTRVSTTVLDRLQNSRSAEYSVGIKDRVGGRKRKRIIKNVSRGRILLSRLRKTGLGLLFLQDIWDYVKTSEETFEEEIAKPFREDSQKMKFLTILDQQVMLLVKDGEPNLSVFFDSLVSEDIMPQEEVSVLRVQFGCEADAVPVTLLDDAVEQLSEKVRQILGKREFDEEDSIKVNDAIEWHCNAIERLRSDQWLDLWTIAAAFEAIDKPSYVRWGYSVPLDEKVQNGEIKLIPQPFARWGKVIDNYRREDDSEKGLIYFCPLNTNTNHFTLLEINEPLGMIYHYDSMASSGVISRKTKQTKVRKAVEEQFKHWGFGYVEHPCPQQKDFWSCGLMVIRNARLRMNGLPVGHWQDNINPQRDETSVQKA